MVIAAWPSLSFVWMLIKPFNLTVLPLSLPFQPFCYFPSSPRPFHVFIFSCVHNFLLFEGFSWPLFCLCIPRLHSTSGLFWWLFYVAFIFACLNSQSLYFVRFCNILFHRFQCRWRVRSLVLSSQSRVSERLGYWRASEDVCFSQKKNVSVIPEKSLLAVILLILQRVKCSACFWLLSLQQHVRAGCSVWKVNRAFYWRGCLFLFPGPSRAELTWESWNAERAGSDKSWKRNLEECSAEGAAASCQLKGPLILFSTRPFVLCNRENSKV